MQIKIYQINPDLDPQSIKCIGLKELGELQRARGQPAAIDPSKTQKPDNLLHAAADEPEQEGGMRMT
jgi:hypothetical protein